MPALRAIVLVLLLVSALCFVTSIVTGDVRWRRRGIVVLKWTLLAAAGFFAVLIAERWVG
jgi:hypothetical protein